MHKKISTLAGFIIIAVEIIVLFGGVFAYQYLSRPVLLCWPYCPGMTDKDREQIKNEAPTASWKTFSDNYGFQMQYPPDANVMVAPTSRIVSCDASFFPNSCPKGISPGYPDKTEKETINGVNYCFYLGDNCGMGSCEIDYSYLTTKNNVCYVLDFSQSRVPTSCDNGSSSDVVQKCKSEQSANQALIDQAVSTIKFTK